MTGSIFDLVLAAGLALVSVSVAVKGIRERSRKHLLYALMGLAMAALLAVLHRDAFL